MDTRTTAAVGGIGALAFMLVGIGLWHVAGALDSITNANVSVALQTATTTPVPVEVANTTPSRVLPHVPRSLGTGSASATETEKAVSAAATVAGVGTLGNLLALKTDLACTVSTMNSSISRTGTVYLSDGSLRGDFISTVDGRELKSSMLDVDGYLYAWQDAGTHGVRLLAASSASGSAVVSYGGLNPTQEVRYSCNLWKSDVTKFAQPTGIIFTDTAGN